jgi:hypothetical protein
VDLTDVVVVGPGVAEEDLLEIERDPLWPPQLLDLGKVIRQVLAVDLRGAAKREMRHAELPQLGLVARARVEANVVPTRAEVMSETGQRQEVAVERHRGEEQPHGRVAEGCGL